MGSQGSTQTVSAGVNGAALQAIYQENIPAQNSGGNGPTFQQRAYQENTQGPLSIRDLWNAIKYITPFTGTADEDAQLWVRRWGHCMRGMVFVEADLVRGIASKLSEKASQWFHDLPPLN